MRNKHKQKVNIFKILSLVIIILLLSFSPKVIQRIIKINNIQCQSQYGQCPENILSYRFTSFSKSLLSIRSQVNKELQNNILVNSYLIQYKIPSTLKVDLVLKKSIFAIKENEGKYFLVDKDGLIVAISDSTNLPYLIIDNNNLQIGQRIDQKMLFLLKIIEKVNYLYSVNSGRMENDHMVIEFDNNLKVLFPFEGDVNYLVGSLRLIFSRLNDGSEGIKMNEIDLRYKEVIIR